MEISVSGGLEGDLGIEKMINNLKNSVFGRCS